MNKQMLKDTAILCIITLIVGVCLAGVNALTREPIAKAEAEEKLAAYRQVFPEAANFETLPAPGEDSMVSEAMTAVDEAGEKLGYVFLSTSPNGYGGDISLALGVTNEGEITAVTVLSMSETPGLGAKCTEADFLDQFAGMNVPEVTYTKTGKTQPNEVDAISGATISTAAVTEAVNAALAYAQSLGEEVAP